MNGPAFAAVLTAGVFFVLGWWVFAMWRERSALITYSSFLAWFVPLFYLGAWAAGGDFGSATIILFALVISCSAYILRQAAFDWVHNKTNPDGAEDEIVNMHKWNDD